VIYLLIAIKAFQVLLGPIYDYLDGKLLGHSLRRSEKKRLAMRDEKLAKGEEYPGWKVHKPTTWFFGMQYLGMVLVSWVVSLKSRKKDMN
jgi:membrane protein DedA with SNARE-associated domain